MTQNDLLTLIDRINVEPSVLLLGQNALASYTGQDPFLYQVNEDRQTEGNDIVRVYRDIWRAFPSGLSSAVCRKLTTSRDKIKPQWWLRKIMSQRWNIVYSTGVDGTITHRVGANAEFSLIPVEATTFKREYISKQQLHVCQLFGHIDADEESDFPPKSLEKTDLRRWNREVSEKLRWIYSDILCNYGVMVIDGWNPSTDVLSIETLMQNWDDMPYHSVYTFGATDEIVSEANELNADFNEIVICDRRSFAQALDSIDFFEDIEDIASAANQPASNYRNISLGKGKNSFSLQIPASVISSLGPQISLLHDDTVQTAQVTTEERTREITKFLQQSDIIRWNLYTDRYGFYVERKIDQALYAATLEELEKDSSYRSKPILLEGSSNSGKTAALIHLALQIQKERLVPVLFIQGVLDQNISKYEDIILGFIKANLFNDKNKRILVIWDGSQDIDTPDRYKHLSDKLRECNATVVGSCYAKMYSGVNDGRKAKFRTLSIDSTLSPEEYKAFGRMISSVDENLYHCFQYYMPSSDAGERNDPWTRESLFYLLQKLAAFSYDPEWQEVTQALNSRFSKELIENQSNIDQQIQVFQQTNFEIEARGLAAAWQIQLEKYCAQQEPEERSTYEKCRAMIQETNRILAVCGQFEKSLPLSLLLHAACGSIFSRESAFITELIKVDSLVSSISDADGYVLVRFRHPSEAEAFLDKNYPNAEEKKNAEIDVLNELVKKCRWENDEESRYMIQVVRQFGPNSSGKYSEDEQNGHYTRYVDYWESMASLLKECAGSSCLEAVIVYSHLLRELHKYNRDHIIIEKYNLLLVAKEALEQALERTDIPPAQHRRLLGEYCANLSATMRESCITGKPQVSDFRTFQEYFKRACNLRDTNENSLFTDNSLLDIWVNALSSLRDSFFSKDDALDNQFFQERLADTVDYIDTLLDINQDHPLLLSKIKDIYSMCDTKRLEELEKKYSNGNKDTFLFLRAHNCWISDLAQKGNLYYLPDDMPIEYDQIRKELVEAANKTVAVLEPSLDLLRRSHSRRCLAMLLRAKWILFTHGHLPMEEKQCPALSKDNWKDIHSLCEDYILFCQNDRTPPRPFAFLLEGVWQWQFGDSNKAKEAFRLCEQLRVPGWFYERIGLCVLETTSLRRFYVDITQNINGKFRAVLRTEINKDGTEISAFPNVLGMKRIAVSSTVLDYLFSPGLPTSKNNITRPVVVWFNAGGACLGIAP